MFQPGLTQVIDSDVHLKAVHCLRVGTHHDAGVVDEDMKVVDLWTGGRGPLDGVRTPGGACGSECHTATLAPYPSGTSVRRLVWSRCLPGPALAPPPELWDERLVCWPLPPPLSPHLDTPWSPAPLSRGETEIRSLKIDNKGELLFKKKKSKLRF